MSLPLKEKELVAIGVSVAAGCKPCTDFHVKAGRVSGADDEEIHLAIEDAICVRENALEVMQAHALQHLGGESEGVECGCVGTKRIKELVSVGAAYAVNCTTNLEQHLAAAKDLGVSEVELLEIIRLSKFIKEKAASHVDKLVCEGNAKTNVTMEPETASVCC
jgi:AhpD family alkylhydroperoxidase